jgi:hypothetical protein
MNWLKQVFSEDNDRASFMRLMSGFVMVVITVTWSIHCFRTVTWTPLDAGSVATILGLAAAKVWQKGKETFQP